MVPKHIIKNLWIINVLNKPFFCSHISLRILVGWGFYEFSLVIQKAEPRPLHENHSYHIQFKNMKIKFSLIPLEAIYSPTWINGLSLTKEELPLLSLVSTTSSVPLHKTLPLMRLVPPIIRTCLCNVFHILYLQHSQAEVCDSITKICTEASPTCRQIVHEQAKSCVSLVRDVLHKIHCFIWIFVWRTSHQFTLRWLKCPYDPER